MTERDTTRVLFVCLGNICRSPTAEGVFRAIVENTPSGRHIEIDSAGTHAYHVGEPPDARAVAAAARRGIDLSGIRGRQATRDDLDRFDYVLAMDRSNYSHLERMATRSQVPRLHLFLDFAPDFAEQEVPDPYYGGEGGFDLVLDLIEAASRGLLAEIQKRGNR